jgi:hypothetical protein
VHVTTKASSYVKKQNKTKQNKRKFYITSGPEFGVHLQDKNVIIDESFCMGFIKSLEMTYMLKSVGITEYYSGENVELLGEAWKNQGL